MRLFRRKKKGAADAGHAADAAAESPSPDATEAAEAGGAAPAAPPPPPKRQDHADQRLHEQDHAADPEDSQEWAGQDGAGLEAPPPPPPARTTMSPEDARIRARLEDFYRRFDSEKLNQLDKIMNFVHEKGLERLDRGLLKKYNCCTGLAGLDDDRTLANLEDQVNSAENEEFGEFAESDSDEAAGQHKLTMADIALPRKPTPQYMDAPPQSHAVVYKTLEAALNARRLESLLGALYRLGVEDYLGLAKLDNVNCREAVWQDLDYMTKRKLKNLVSEAKDCLETIEGEAPKGQLAVPPPPPPPPPPAALARFGSTSSNGSASSTRSPPPLPARRSDRSLTGSVARDAGSFRSTGSDMPPPLAEPDGHRKAFAHSSDNDDDDDEAGSISGKDEPGGSADELDDGSAVPPPPPPLAARSSWRESAEIDPSLVPPPPPHPRPQSTRQEAGKSGARAGRAPGHASNNSGSEIDEDENEDDTTQARRSSRRHIEKLNESLARQEAKARREREELAKHAAATYHDADDDEASADDLSESENDEEHSDEEEEHASSRSRPSHGGVAIPGMSAANDEMQRLLARRGQGANHSDEDGNDEAESDGQADAPCKSFRLDMTAREFNTCKCGFKRSEHQSQSVAAPPMRGSQRFRLDKDPYPPPPSGQPKPASPPRKAEATVKQAPPAPPPPPPPPPKPTKAESTSSLSSHESASASDGAEENGSFAAKSGSSRVINTRGGDQGHQIDYRGVVSEFYEQYNPEKLADLDRIMKRFAGREEQLIEMLEKKYCI